MQTATTTYLGYFKYTGASVANGYLDARTSAEALIGIDEVLRYFLYQEAPGLQQIEFEIPVKVGEEGWQALIPGTLGEGLITALGTGATTYLTTALKKAAENDLNNKEGKDIVKEAFKAIKWVIKIAAHMKSMAVKKFAKAEFNGSEDGEDKIGIGNANDVLLYVPQKYLEAYAKCPEKLFTRLAKLVKEERELEINLHPAQSTDNDDRKEPARLTVTDKYLFTKREDEEETVFPHLKHGQYVELGGHVTRGNENTNTIGFDYQSHILICTPSGGKIQTYKSLLFTNCLIKGYIDRIDEEGNQNEKKPRVRFIDLIDVSRPDTQLGLFTQ